jgi:hypothetical protein
LICTSGVLPMEWALSAKIRLMAGSLCSVELALHGMPVARGRPVGSNVR